MAYRLKYSDYSTTASGPPDPAAWVGPPGPMGPPGPQGIPGATAPVIATGSTALRSVQDRAGDVTNVRDFGAAGNGITNDTAAIQAAANAIAASGGILLFPEGVYVVNAAIAVSSNTLVKGQGATLLGAPTGFATGSPLLTNKNNAATSLTDHDIILQDMTLDYGASAPGGGAHAVLFQFARNVAVTACTIQCRGSGDAVAMIGCYNSLIEGCTAYGFVNCAFDHWWGPQHGRVVGCYAETATSAQMVNFNPELTVVTGSAGLIADGLVLADNEFVGTGANHVPILIEPLSAGTIVRNVTITGNIFNNVSLSMRGDARNVIVANNTFVASRGGGEVITSYVNNGATGTGFVISGNTVTDPDTVAGSAGVIRIQGPDAIIVGNRISGTGYAAPAIYVTNAASVVGANSAQSVGINAPLLPVNNGLTFGSTFAATASTLSLDLYGGVFGFSVTSNSGLNFNCGGGGFFGLYSGGTIFATVGPSGTNMLAPIASTAFQVASPAGPTIRAGTGAATGTQPKGSLWLRTDGAVGSTLYVTQGGGAWAAIAGV